MAPRPLTVAAIDDDDDWLSARGVRQRVFIEEQSCPPDEEWDEHDPAPGAWTSAPGACRHFLGRVGKTVAATARWRPVVDAGEPAAKLERFAILRDFRGSGRGRSLVLAVMDDARRAGHRRFLLHAQAHLRTFYAGLGFEVYGEPFSEAGIPHLKMRRLESDAASLRRG